MIVLSAVCRGLPLTASNFGIDGPKMSASSTPTLRPRSRKASARLTAVVDLPTPPLPDATAMMAPTPGIPLTPCARCAAAAAAGEVAPGPGGPGPAPDWATTLAPAPACAPRP